MRKFRWWNSFNLLGILLIGVSLIGLASGGRFVFDPGRPQKGYEWALYLVAGVLMLVNGFLSPAVPQRKDK